MVQAAHIILPQRSPKFSFDKVGQCIYCGISGQETILTDEHIVPDGLNGNLVLPEASCQKCQRHINDFEFQAMRYSLNLGRAKYGVRSKKGVKRGKKKVTASGNGHDHFEIGPNMPTLVAISHYNRKADAITGRHGDDAAANTLAWSPIKTLPPTVKVRPGDMTRFAAKIAHAYATAVFGIHKFKPFLIDHILGHGDKGIPLYLGITDSLPVQVPAVVDIEAFDMIMPVYLLPSMPAVNRHVIIVKIRLFSVEYDLPTYEIVAGEII